MQSGPTWGSGSGSCVSCRTWTGGQRIRKVVKITLSRVRHSHALVRIYNHLPAPSINWCIVVVSCVTILPWKNWLRITYISSCAFSNDYVLIMWVMVEYASTENPQIYYMLHFPCAWDCWWWFSIFENMKDLSWTRISIQVITHWNSIATYMYNNGSAGWECLAKILASDLTNGMVCDIGLPVEQHGFRYNCRVYGLNSQVLLIRPKIYVANDGNYRDLRWFSSWKRLR